MATTKKPPIRNAGTTGKPTTASGRGVVDRGRQESRAIRNGNGNGTRTSSSRTTTARPSPPKNWWDSVQDDRDHPMKMAAASFHRAADALYRPELAPDADRPTGKPSKLSDERLYTSNTKPAAKKAPAKPVKPITTTKTRSR